MRYDAVRHALDYLPLVQKAVKQIRGPSSPQAQQVHKLFKSALREYVDGAKQGLIFFRDMAGGPGQRAAHETGMVRRAATGRLVFSMSMFEGLAKSGRKHMDLVSSFLGKSVT